MSSGPEASAPRSGEFFAPLPLAALALLVVNDVYLKAKFHNFVTGKLSDLAVCFLMPLFLSELLGLTLGIAPRLRLTMGAATTAVLFSVLEVVPSAAAWSVNLLSRIGPHLGLGCHYAMTADITDLACVPVVLLAYGYGWRRVLGVVRAPELSA
ncbi:MAG TPA: hypothetical protein VFQ61_00055 [Polyangiaceae bacterium]|nr:hypothetical protein [Polyangiaceae bacterium]